MSSPMASAKISSWRSQPRWNGNQSIRSLRLSHGAQAEVDGQRVLVGNRRLMTSEGIDLGDMSRRRDEFAAEGRTAVLVAVDGKAAGVLALADAPRDSAAAAVTELHDMNIQVVMLTGDNQATAQRIADQLGIDTVIAEVLPADKAAKITELQQQGKRVAMVGDGVNDAPALAAADLGIAIGAGTDVAIETADVVLMRSDPVDVPTSLRIGKGTLRKMRQNLGWAIGYNAIALPIAAGVFEPAFGLVLRPEIAALSMSGSSFLVAVNALLLKRLRLPAPGETASGRVAEPPHGPPPIRSEPGVPAVSESQPAGAAQRVGQEGHHHATSPRLAGSVRTVVLILAVLGYRRRLRRRDNWNRPRLLAQQQRALAHLRAYAYDKVGVLPGVPRRADRCPLAELPVLTKQTLMDNFDRLATRPE